MNPRTLKMCLICGTSNVLHLDECGVVYSYELVGIRHLKSTKMFVLVC